MVSIITFAQVSYVYYCDPKAKRCARRLAVRNRPSAHSLESQSLSKEQLARARNTIIIICTCAALLGGKNLPECVVADGTDDAAMRLAESEKIHDLCRIVALTVVLVCIDVSDVIRRVHAESYMCELIHERSPQICTNQPSTVGRTATQHGTNRIRSHTAHALASRLCFFFTYVAHL